MGFWIVQPQLGPGEKVRWKSSAGRALNRWITSGGQLVVTNRRILFQPNRFDMATGKKSWECPLSSVEGFEVVNRDLTALAGGMRERLGIRTAKGQEVFVVNHLTDKIDELRGMFEQA
jgi:hypothetical protein